jgi:hypothetical protein
VELRRRGRGPVALPALILLLLAGCASPGRTPAPDPATTRAAAAPSASAPARNAYTYRLPLAAYSYSDAEYEVIESAQRVLARDCMREFGLSYPTAKKSAPPVTSDRRYGISDRKVAARYGYHLPPQPADPQPKLGADQRRVLYGNRNPGNTLTYRGKEIPELGCLGSAVRELARPYEYPAGVTTASNISSDSYRKSLADPAVKALFARWSACMKGKGYAYASPMDPFRTPAFTAGRASAREKATATADMACKERSDLLEAWLKVETRIQRGMIREHLGVLRRLQRLHAEKVSAARKIVAGA